MTMTATAAEPLVHIVDDDPAILDALSWLFRSRGMAVRLWSRAEEVSAASVLDHGVLLLDVRMGEESGLALFDRLRTEGCRLPVVFLTGHADVSMAVEALKRGAVDFIEKPFNDNDLVDRVMQAQAIAEARRAAAERRAGLGQRLSLLTLREREVMERMLAGLLNKQIAEELGIGLRTVEVHRSRVLEKTGARNAVELAQLVAEGR